MEQDVAEAKNEAAASPKLDKIHKVQNTDDDSE